jgi:alkanesulfonate monooxygenase SsuD/methylene tetrahydromethanopterin reductase-like flavin-dependent oxidoreductase (luciferase family)
VLIIPYRNPVVLAKMLATLDQLARGRLRLGIGVSHKVVVEQMWGLSLERPVEAMREYFSIVRSGLDEGTVDFAGEYVTARTSIATPVRTPVMGAAAGLRAFELCGELSDGAISWLCPVDYLVGTALPALRAGAAAAGRPAPPLVGHVPVAAHPDRARVRRTARATFAPYARLPFYRHMFADAGFPVPEDETLPDALLDALVVAGDAATVRDRLAAIQAAGVAELLITQVPIEDADAEEAALSAVLAG